MNCLHIAHLTEMCKVHNIVCFEDQSSNAEKS